MRVDFGTLVNSGGGLPPGWTTGGHAPWSGVHNPTHTDEGRCYTQAFKAGTISHNQFTLLEVVKTVPAGNIVFSYWVSSEENFDGLRLWVDLNNDGSFDLATGFISGDSCILKYGRPCNGVSYPAAFPEAIAVGASSNFDCRSTYSQFGPQLDFVASSNGGSLGIPTTDRTGAAGYDTNANYTGTFGGTSSATPLAAGVAGLMLSHNPDLTQAQVRQILRDTADKVGPEPYVAGRNDRYGFGRINAFKAVTASLTIGPCGGWSPVPGGGLTPSSPEGVAFNGEPWLFVRGTNNRLYLNRLTGGSWTGWSEVPGGGLTPSSPGAVVFNNELYLFVRGTDDALYLNRWTGTSWAGWGGVPGGGRTPSSPAAAVWNNALYLFVRGTDSRIYINGLSGSAWTGWGEVPGGGFTPSRPTATVFQSTLYLVVQGTNNHIYDKSFTLAGWTGWAEVPGGGLTPSGPTAAVFTGELRYFVRGTNERIYQNRLPAGAGGTWTGWSEVSGNGLTPSELGATATASTLYLVVRGTDNGIYVNQGAACGSAALEEHTGEEVSVLPEETVP
jgi:hypothetical protein